MSDDYYATLSTTISPLSLNSTNNETSSVIGGKGSYGALLFWTASGFGWVGASAVPTGWLLLLIISIMVFFALPFIRRKGYFQVSESSSKKNWYQN